MNQTWAQECGPDEHPFDEVQSVFAGLSVAVEFIEKQVSMCKDSELRSQIISLVVMLPQQTEK